jgi:catechol 2,3-dioxygenase-like lactoylglutathione lyase family enzyme
MIDHTGIGVADVARAAAFYDAALGALGLRRVIEMPASDRVHRYDGAGSDAVRTGTGGATNARFDGIGYGTDYPVFWIDRFHPPGVKQHVAFKATSRQQVNAFHTAALEAGGTDNGLPGLRDPSKGYLPGYYAAFVFDPDGNNIEAVFRGG